MPKKDYSAIASAKRAVEMARTEDLKVRKAIIKYERTRKRIDDKIDSYEKNELKDHVYANDIRNQMRSDANHIMYPYQDTMPTHIKSNKAQANYRRKQILQHANPKKLAEKATKRVTASKRHKESRKSEESDIPAPTLSSDDIHI